MKELNAVQLEDVNGGLILPYHNVGPAISIGIIKIYASIVA